MRNILVFPDGTEQDFMYPPNREITVGEKLQAEWLDDTVHIYTVREIEKTEKAIYYYLSY